MAIQIIINGDTAEHALFELTSFSAGLSRGQAVTPAATAEAPKATRTRSTTKPEAVKPEESKQEQKLEPYGDGPDDASDDQDPSDDEAPIPTDVDLRAAAQAKGNEGADKKALIKPLLTKYGVANITAIPADQRVEFLAELQAL
jgi:hypothetical protein